MNLSYCYSTMYLSFIVNIRTVLNHDWLLCTDRPNQLNYQHLVYVLFCQFSSRLFPVVISAKEMLLECVCVCLSCESVLPCDGLVTCPRCTPPPAHTLLEIGTSFPATHYGRRELTSCVICAPPTPNPDLSCKSSP
ncbi:hypothetical protein XENOCAPTIV_013782 [Xenoophorus captivus]|uniref:Uncharacterized protein n=1 Tax=Xenoophorus captivus TaxID=1517983 RepID=A0ABV0R9Y1_9TELE